MDDPSLRALLAKAEHERTGARRAGARAIWALAGAMLTALVWYLAVPIGGAVSHGFARTLALALALAAAFGVIALYCWIRVVQHGVNWARTKS